MLTERGRVVSQILQARDKWNKAQWVVLRFEGEGGQGTGGAGPLLTEYSRKFNGNGTNSRELVFTKQSTQQNTHLATKDVETKAFVYSPFKVPH